MEKFDPRTISNPVCISLQELRVKNQADNNKLKEQKNQAVELYTYLATWGMLRLKAEEQALNQEGKKQIVKEFFKILQNLSKIENIGGIQGLKTLQTLSVDDYLGLTGLGLKLAEEFSFWANAIYHDIKGDN
jgi:hypothetical protein